MIGRNSLVNKGLTVLKMLFPSAVIRWLMLLMLAILILGFALTELLAVHLIGIVAAMLGSPLVLIGMVTIPTQMVALASNRVTVFFPRLRSIVLVLYWLISLLLSVTICWVWDSSQLNHFSLHMFLAVWLTTSLIFQASVWLCTLSQVTHFLLFAIYLMLGDIFTWLENFNPIYVASFVLISWCLFASWWFSWKPAKYKVNPFFVGTVKHAITLSEQNHRSWFYRGNANSWLGSRLTGAGDSWLARSKRILPKLGTVPLSFVPGYFLLGDEWLRGFVFLSCFAGCGIVAPVILVNYGLNLNRIWLCSPGSRSELLCILQKRFWLDLLLPCAALLFVGFCVSFFWGPTHDLDAWLYFLLSLFLLYWLAFYFHWWLYQRTQGNLMWTNLVSMALAFGWFLMSIATGFLVKWPVTVPVISPLWIVIPELVLLLLLYKPVQRGFALVNFARAG